MKPSGKQPLSVGEEAAVGGLTQTGGLVVQVVAVAGFTHPQLVSPVPVRQVKATMGAQAKHRRVRGQVVAAARGPQARREAPAPGRAA